MEAFYREMIREEHKRHPGKYSSQPEFPKKYPTSCLLGVVDVQDVWTREEYAARTPKYLKPETSNDFAFVLRNPRRLPIPIKCKGGREIYEIPNERAAIAMNGVKSVRTDFLEFFSKKYEKGKLGKGGYYDIRFERVEEGAKQKQVVVSKNLQKVWDNGGLIDFAEKEREKEKLNKEKDNGNGNGNGNDNDLEPKKSESPDKIMIQLSKNNKKKKRNKNKHKHNNNINKNKINDQYNDHNQKKPQKQHSEAPDQEKPTADIFAGTGFDEHIEDEKDYATGKLLRFKNDKMAQMGVRLLTTLKKSLKPGFENLKTFDLDFFQSEGFGAFVHSLVRTRYHLREEGVWSDLDSLLRGLRFDCVKYQSSRKWRRMERTYQVLFVIGDGVKVTNDSRTDFITIQDNQALVIDPDYCRDGFLVKELKTNERAKSSHLETFGGYNSLLLGFYFSGLD